MSNGERLPPGFSRFQSGTCVAQDLRYARTRLHEQLFGRWTGHGAPSAPSRIVDQSLFRFLLGLEIQKSRRLQYSVSVICMQVEAGRPSSMAHLAQRVIDQVRSTDVVVELSPQALALLLVHAEPFSLPAIVHRLTEHLQGFLPQTAVLSWSAGGACYPQTAGEAEAVLKQARELMTRARDDGGNRLYLPATEGRPP
jgi:hypothetical protein